ncbi:hypothetical protein B0H16DRAFT_1730727 [Mycena metata]|uniref:SNF2 N-terminal domain-containing protein n=1 Tax=Mycena metata TaxID=1033252 RepID=A0AAD7I795_9AGAR|nr:hypothetical protein B0H16DRAFT_1730727 [Mycena metata]
MRSPATVRVMCLAPTPIHLRAAPPFPTDAVPTTQGTRCVSISISTLHSVHLPPHLPHSSSQTTLTGTPVTNSLADICGLLRSGRFRPWNDFNAFNEHVAKVQLSDAPLAGQRAQMILKPLLLRRTMTSTLEGKPASPPVPSSSQAYPL